MEKPIDGIKDTHKALNEFIDIKVDKGYPDCITRTELNTFLKEYTRLWEEHFRANQPQNQ